MVAEFVSQVGPSQTDYPTLALWVTAHVGNYTSAQMRVYEHGGISGGAIDDQDTITGGNNGYDATVIHCTSSKILVYHDTPAETYEANEVLTVSGKGSVTVDSGDGGGDTARPVAECGTAGGADDSTDTTISASWITNSTNYYIIRPQSGHDHEGTWDDSKYVRVINSTSIRCWARGRIIGIQFSYAGTAQYKTAIRGTDCASGSEPVAIRCIIRGNASEGGESKPIYDAKTVNCLIYDWPGTNSRAIYTEGGLAYNDTIHNCAYGIRHSSLARLKNNIIQSCTYDRDPGSTTQLLENSCNVGEDITNYSLIAGLTSGSAIYSSGTAKTGTTGTTLYDSAADFIADGVKVGCIVRNVTDTQHTHVTVVVSQYELTLAANAGFGVGDSYNVYTNRIGSVAFDDESGDDFRLTAGDLAAKDLGLDLSADASWPFDDDITGLRTRVAPWDLGAYEYFAFDATLTDGVQFADSPVVTGDWQLHITDGFTLHDEATGGYLVHQADTVQLDDTCSIRGDFVLTVNDGFSLADAPSAYWDTDIGVTDGMTFAEAASCGVAVTRTITDGFIFDEEVWAQPVTIYTAIVDPGGGGDYGSLHVCLQDYGALAEDDEHNAISYDPYAMGDLVSIDARLRILLRNSNASNDTYAVDPGFITNPLCYYEIIPDTGYSHAGTYPQSQDNIHRIVVTGNHHGLHITSAYARVNGICIDMQTGDWMARCGIRVDPVAGVRIERPIVKTDTATGDYLFGIYIDLQSGTLGEGNGYTAYISNAAVWGFDGSGGVGIYGAADENGLVVCYSSGVEGCEVGYQAGSIGGNFLAKDCWAFNCTTSWDTSIGTFHEESSTNAFGEVGGWAPNSETASVDLSGYAGSDIFIKYETHDFHLKSGSPLAGVGLDLSTDVWLPITEDFDEETRTAWDLGPDEYDAGYTPPTGAIPVTATDGFQFADLPTGVVDFGLTVDDGFQCSEAVSNSVDFLLTASDVASFAETVSVTGTIIPIECTDGIAFADVPLGVLQAILTATDDLRLDDTAAVAHGANVTLSEVVTFSDTPLASLGVVIAAVDAMQFSDSVSRAATLIVSVAEALQVAETVSGSLEMNFHITDEVAWSDVVAAAIDGLYHVTDGFVLDDSNANSLTLAVGRLRVVFSLRRSTTNFELL